MFRKRILFLPAALVTLLLLSVLHGNVFAASSFYDVTDDLLYSPYIQKLYDAHLITGDTDNGKETYRYRPKDSLTRAEFTKVAVGVKLAEKYGVKEDWQGKSAYEITETVLKDKLLYFHGCSNADLPSCTSLCGADICGVCNVCQIIGEKPFTDVAVKSRNCEEQGVCTPWYSEYIYYALRKGMIKGYRGGSTYAFHPNDPILRIHALKLVMADDGAVDPEADERYRRLSQTAKSRGSYYPKCLSGAENLILNNNGGAGSGDGEKLLKYALLADKLDFFGNTCQIFNQAGARTPQQRADFLQKPITRQEVARYFVLSTSYSPLQFSAADDPTVEEVVSLLTDANAPKLSDNPALQATDPAAYKDPTNLVYAENIPIQTDPFESTYNRPACIKSLSTPRLCKDASVSNCITVADGTKVTTTDEELYGRTPAGYYTWLWHGVVHNGKNYYVPTDDLSFNCTATVKASIVKNQVLVANSVNDYYALTSTVTFQDPNCGVTMSCDPSTAPTVSSGQCGVNMSCNNERYFNEVILPKLTPKKVTAATVTYKSPNCGVTMSCDPTPKKPVSNGDWIGNAPGPYGYMDTISAPQKRNAIEEIQNFGLKLYYDLPGTLNQVNQDVQDKVLQSAWQLEGAVYSVGDTISTTWDAVTDLPGTTSNLYSAVTNPVRTVQGLWDYAVKTGTNITTECSTYSRECNVEQGRSKGEVLQLIIPAEGALKGVEFGTRLAKVAEGFKILVKYEEIAAKAEKYLQPLNDIVKLTEEFTKRKPIFDKTLLEVAEKTGAEAELTGIKTATSKGFARAERKGAAETVKDYLRGTLKYDSMDDLYLSVKELEKNFDIVDVKNSIDQVYPSGYRDIKVMVKDADGYVSEIQLMPQEIFEAKKIETPINNIRGEFDNLEKHAPDLSDIKAAKEELRIKSPEIYQRVEKDIDAIIEHVKSGKSGTPTAAIGGLNEVSKSIFEDAWRLVKK